MRDHNGHAAAKLIAATWLDETAGRRKQTGTRHSDGARDGRSEGTSDPFPRPAASKADRGGYHRGATRRRAISCRRAGNRRALAASQGRIAREITKLQAADEEILEKIPAPAAHRPAAPASKPTPMARPSSRAPIPLHLPPHR
jgi:hypothetical protein